MLDFDDLSALRDIKATLVQIQSFGMVIGIHISVIRPLFLLDQ